MANSLAGATLTVKRSMFVSIRMDRWETIGEFRKESGA